MKAFSLLFLCLFSFTYCIEEISMKQGVKKLDQKEQAHIEQIIKKLENFTKIASSLLSEADDIHESFEEELKNFEADSNEDESELKEEFDDWTSDWESIKENINDITEESSAWLAVLKNYQNASHTEIHTLYKNSLSLIKRKLNGFDFESTDIDDLFDKMKKFSTDDQKALESLEKELGSLIKYYKQLDELKEDILDTIGDISEENIRVQELIENHITNQKLTKDIEALEDVLKEIEPYVPTLQEMENERAQFESVFGNKGTWLAEITVGALNPYKKVSGKNERQLDFLNTKIIKPYRQLYSDLISIGEEIEKGLNKHPKWVEVTEISKYKNLSQLPKVNWSSYVNHSK